MSAMCVKVRSAIFDFKPDGKDHTANGQSVNIPIHTAIGPMWNTRASIIARVTRHSHMERTETVILNFTSPAARSP